MAKKKGVLLGKTVQDGSITKDKLEPDLQEKLEKEGNYLPLNGNSSSKPMTGQIFFKHGNSVYSAYIQYVYGYGDEDHFNIHTSGILNLNGTLETYLTGGYIVIRGQSVNVDSSSFMYKNKQIATLDDLPNLSGYLTNNGGTVFGAFTMDGEEKLQFANRENYIYVGEGGYGIRLQTPGSFTYNGNEVATEKTLESYLKKSDVYSGSAVKLGTDSAVAWEYISSEEMNNMPVSIGNPDLKRRIMFVKDGMQDWDAATFGQLKKKVGLVFSEYKQLTTTGTDIFTFDEGKILRMWRGNPSNLADILYVGVRNNASTNSYNTCEYSQKCQSGSSGSAGSGTISATTSTSAAFSTTIPSTNSYAEIMLFMSTSTARTTTSRYRITINCFSTAGFCWITIEKIS